jgi:CRISPR/Cas system-associated exonuclease Cas4 (RecB family)
MNQNSGSTDHGKFSPSQADRFFACPGSVKLLEGLPARPSSKYAERGTKAHELLEIALKHGEYNAKDAHAVSSFKDQQVEPSFYAGVNEAVTWVRDTFDLVDVLHGDPQLFSETKVTVPVLNTDPKEASGSCDIIIYSPEARTVWVADYKNGVASVEVEYNKQMLQYAAGFIFSNGLESSIDSVVLTIIQPNAFHPQGSIRSQYINMNDIKAYRDALDKKINEALSDTPILNPGDSQCKYCDARSVCPALETKALSLLNPIIAKAEDFREDDLPNIDKLDVNRLVYIHGLRNLIDTWFKDIEERLYDLLQSGHDVPGLKLVHSNPRREWYGDEATRAVELAKMLKCEPDDLYETSFRTITDIERKAVDIYKGRVSKADKRQAAVEAKNMIALFTDKKVKDTLTMVSDSDPRPAVHKAIEMFSGVTINQ